MTAPPGPVLELDRVVHRFHVAGRTRRLNHARRAAVDGVSLRLDRAETVAVVGESGSGKTTLARCAVRLLAPTEGAVRIGGADVTRARGRKLRALRDEVQMVFQDPTASLNPRRRAGEAVEANLGLRGIGRSRQRSEAVSLLERVGLRAEHADRRPHELSVGERQRVAIARALASEPSALVIDEPVAALDARVQARVLDLLLLLRQELGLAYLLISHDIGVVRRLADRILVMRAGREVESGPTEEVVSEPRDSYTRELVAAAPAAPTQVRR